MSRAPTRPATTTDSGGQELPTAILSAQRSMQWSLATPPPPMQFLSLEQLQQGNTTPLLSTGETTLEIVALLARHSQVISNNDENNDPESNHNRAEYWARIATALLLLGHGYTDHAHNLVGPLSFPQELAYFYGPPVQLSSQQKDILAAASAVHCLVHRKEGWNDSEFGMKGMENANYWAGATLRSGGEETLPLTELQGAVETAVHQFIVAHNKITTTAATTLARDWWTTAHRDFYSAAGWDPRPVTELCGVVLQHNANNHSNQRPHRLQALAEQAALAEALVLLRHALTQLGYNTRPLQQCHQDTAASMTPVAAVATQAALSLHPSETKEWKLPRTLQQAMDANNNPWRESALVITTSQAPHRIVHVNDAWVNLCGYTAQEAAGKTFSILQGPDTNTTNAAAIVQLSQQTRVPQQSYLVNYTASGQGFLNHLTVAPLLPSNANFSSSWCPEYMVGILEKIKDLPPRVDMPQQQRGSMHVR